MHARGGQKKGPRLKITDIMDRDDGKPSGKNLIKGLEDNVRKVLAAKKKEFDRVNFELKSKKAELEKLRLALRDVQIDGRALGLDDYPDHRDRLQPVKAISNRRVYSKGTGLDKQVEELEQRKLATQKAIMTGQVYDFMRKRLMAEVVAEKKRNQALSATLTRETTRNTDLKRQHIAVGEALGKAMMELAQLRKDVEHELYLWREEIKDREAWAAQKEEFESFLDKQLEHQRKLAAAVASESKEAPSDKPDPTVSRKLGEAYLATDEEDSKYEAAFRRIGVNPDDLDVAKVIEACRHQDDVRKDLIRKRAAEEQRVAYLQAQLTDAQRTLQATLADRERTTNRVLSETERSLSELETKLDAERSEFQFMQQSLQPVKIGLQHLAKKVLGVDVDLTDASEVTLIMQQLQKQLSIVMEESKSVASLAEAGREPLPPPPVTQPPPNSTEVKPSLQASFVDPKDDAPGWLLSAHNVRVAAEDAAAGARAADYDDDRADYSSDSDMDVLDRGELKKMANNILHHGTRKARKARKAALQ